MKILLTSSYKCFYFYFLFIFFTPNLFAEWLQLQDKKVFLDEQSEKPIALLTETSFKIHDCSIETFSNIDFAQVPLEKNLKQFCLKVQKSFAILIQFNAFRKENITCNFLYDRKESAWHYRYLGDLFYGFRFSQIVKEGVDQILLADENNIYTFHFKDMELFRYDVICFDGFQHSYDFKESKAFVYGMNGFRQRKIEFNVGLFREIDEKWEFHSYLGGNLTGFYFEADHDAGVLKVYDVDKKTFIFTTTINKDMHIELVTPNNKANTSYSVFCFDDGLCLYANYQIGESEFSFYHHEGVNIFLKSDKTKILDVLGNGVPLILFKKEVEGDWLSRLSVYRDDSELKIKYYQEEIKVLFKLKIVEAKVFLEEEDE